ncbi:MAG: tyrosine-type recombinase/integrase, partial [Desulfotomaculales bacterium]
PSPVHNLPALAREAEVWEDLDAERRRFLRTLTAYAMEVRYPERNLWGLTSGTLQDRLRSLKGAERTVRDLYCTVRTALRQAAAWGRLTSDPTVGLRVPKAERREPAVLTPEELGRLLDAVRRYRHHLVIRLAALFGLRLGEVLGLEWGDMDFAKGTLSVRRSVDCRRRKVKSEPETAASRRTLTMDPETLELLKAHQEAQKKVAPLRKEPTWCSGPRTGGP